MAPLLFKDIKLGRSFSCSSASSVAVCKSIDNISIIQPITGRAIDRYTPHLNDPYRTAKFQPTSRLKPLNLQDTSRRSSAKPAELIAPAESSRYLLSSSPLKLKDTSRRSSAKPAELIAPDESSRYLLSPSRFKVEDSAFIDIFPDAKQVPQWVSVESLKTRGSKITELPVFQPPVSDASEDQVVALRVSLHCKGCAGKVSKHISKMQGVKSFSVDWKTKKVMVRGEVTPLNVLNSVSKVKNAQFWQSPPRASMSASMNNAQCYYSPPRASAYF